MVSSLDTKSSFANIILIPSSLFNSATVKTKTAFSAVAFPSNYSNKITDCSFFGTDVTNCHIFSLETGGFLFFDVIAVLCHD